MWRVDRSGGFRFSDKDDPSQLRLFSGYTEQVLADELMLRLGGKILTVGSIKEFVLTETPAYRFKSCLRALEKSGHIHAIDAPQNRRKGTFPDESMRIQFIAGSSG